MPTLVDYKLELEDNDTDILDINNVSSYDNINLTVFSEPVSDSIIESKVESIDFQLDGSEVRLNKADISIDDLTNLEGVRVDREHFRKYQSEEVVLDEILKSLTNDIMPIDNKDASELSVEVWMNESLNSLIYN